MTTTSKNGIPGTLAEIVQVATALARSGYFTDARDPDQALTKIMAGAELGFPPVASMTGIVVLKGRITLSANLIAAAIKRSGRYDYCVKRLDSECCELEFLEFENGGHAVLGRSSFTIADARRAKLSGQNWDSYPRNMMFARALSNGAKWFCPDVFGGPVYIRDEVAQDAEVEPLPAGVIETTAVEPARRELAGEETASQEPIIGDSDGAAGANGNGHAPEVPIEHQAEPSDWPTGPEYAVVSVKDPVAFRKNLNAFAKKVPLWQSNGEANVPAILSAARELGHMTISGANWADVKAALIGFADSISAQEAKEGKGENAPAQ